MTYVYGEDALTLWVLTKRLKQFLGQLDDFTSPEKAIVFFRPSFGRRYGFGEFDAIVKTSKALYLVESKWSKTKIGDVQIKRHEKIKWCCTEWEKQAREHQTWEDFRHAYKAQFENPKIELPQNPDSVVAKNLKFVFDLIADKDIPIMNVLLLFKPNEQKDKQRDSLAGFKRVFISEDSNMHGYEFFRFDGMELKDDFTTES